MGLTGSRQVNQIVSRRDLLEHYASLFSCYDYRVEPGAFDLSRQALNKLVQKMRVMFPSRRKAFHIRDKRALGMAAAAVIMHNKEAAKALLDIVNRYNHREKQGDIRIMDIIKTLPNPGYVSSFVITLDGYSIVLYNVPQAGARDTVLSGIDRLAEKFKGEVHYGSTIPVHNCSGMLGFSEEAIRVNMEHYERVKNEPVVPSRMPFLDHIITAMLDWDPWASITKLRDITLLFSSRLGEYGRFMQKLLGEENNKLRYRYILRHYRMLSEYRVIGRIRLKIWDKWSSVIITAPIRCSEKLYALTAAILGSSSINVFDDIVMAGVAIPETFRENVMLLLSECDEAVARPAVRGLLLPFPFEYYDPVEGVWKEKPVDVMTMLYKFRLADREGGAMPPPV